MAYREFTTGGYWRALQHYEFNRGAQERRKQGMLSPFCGETRKGKEKQRSEPLSLCCSFFIILFWLMAVYLQGHKQPEI